MSQYYPSLSSISTPKIRLCVLGGQCGKSSFICRFVSNTFEEEESPTIEFSFSKSYNHNGETFQLEIKDTSGDDTYSDLRSKWFDFGEGFIFVVNVNSKVSLQEAIVINRQLLESFRPVIPPRILVATGIDKERVVSSKEILDLASTLQCPFWEVSAKTGVGIERSIAMIVNEVLNYRRLASFYRSCIERNTKKKEKEKLKISLPKAIDSNLLARSDLVTPHILLSRYRDVGTIVLNYLQEKPVTFTNSSPIIASHWNDPHFLTIHQNKVIQLINVGSKACSTFTLNKDLPSDPYTIFLDLNKSLFIVTSKTLWCFVEGEWENPEPSKVVALTSPGASALFGDLEERSQLYSSWLLLGTKSLFQLWYLSSDLSKAELKLQYSLIDLETFSKIYFVQNLLVSRTHSTVLVWNLTELETPPVKIQLAEPYIITSLHVDYGFVIIGDNVGSVQVFHQSSSSLWRFLTPEKNIDTSKSSIANLTKRVNALIRIGRLVWVATQDGHLACYDLYQSHTPPIFNISSKDKAMKSLIYDQERFSFTAKVQKEGDPNSSKNPKKKTIFPSDLTVWNPNLLLVRDYFSMSQSS